MACLLVIEDDGEYRELLKEVLENAGFEVCTASNGEEGLESIADLPCEVVITDILMPVKEGMETILELKRVKPETKIVAISGGGSSGRGQDLLMHATLMGAHHTMAKPIVMKELVALVQSLVPA